MSNNIDKIFGFLSQVGNLRFNYRFGAHPKLRGKESIAAHSWRLGLVAMLVLDELELDLDRVKCYEMAMTHDLVESIAKDTDYVLIAKGEETKERKLEKEKKAMVELKKMLTERESEKIDSLWQEYVERKTREAKFIYALDKLETLKTLLEFGYEYFDEPEFIVNYADESVGDFVELKLILSSLKDGFREEWKKAGWKWKEKCDTL